MELFDLIQARPVQEQAKSKEPYAGSGDPYLKFPFGGVGGGRCRGVPTPGEKVLQFGASPGRWLPLRGAAGRQGSVPRLRHHHFELVLWPLWASARTGQRQQHRSLRRRLRGVRREG